jgi:hypothetical protein
MDKRQRSLTVTANRITVPDSPLNPVKRELGWMLAGGALLWLLAGRTIPSAGGQLALLFGYGIVAALRLVYRTRRIVRRAATETSK